MQQHAQNVQKQLEDANVNQRLSKAVTEAFVAAQVGGMIQGLDSMSERDRVVLTKLFLLVSPDSPLCSPCSHHIRAVPLDNCRRRTDRLALSWTHSP